MSAHTWPIIVVILDDSKEVQKKETSNINPGSFTEAPQLEIWNSLDIEENIQIWLTKTFGLCEESFVIIETESSKFSLKIRSSKDN